MALEQWTIQDSQECYNIRNWGKDYFSINEKGNVAVHPDKNPARAIDVRELTDQLRTRGIQLPILIRFTDILRHRVRELHEAFKNAMTEYEYHGGYSCVYPIKVNQQRHVVEEILDFGREFGFGLEAGSKPELLAVLAVTAGNGVPVICNGFKDDEFIETVIFAQKIGRHVIPVVEKFTELELIVRHAERLGVRPKIGVRVKLASKGSGRWESSAGYRAKFGLNVMELIAAIDYLKERKMEDCLNLLHFHIGSQVTNIRKIKEALAEAGRIYVEMIRAGAGLTMIDVGGGLGVDYDGSQSNFESSINYTLQEYANDIVFRIKTVCDEAKVAQPKIISESGRAITAYHSLLVFNVLGVARFDDQKPMKKLLEDAPQQLKDLRWILDHINKKNFIESYHDAVQIREDALNLFNLGFFSLEKRGEVESLYWRICGRIQKIVKDFKHVPDELENLEQILADTYFCNFSIFQSMPDSWAIRQLFPIMPLQRLGENPTRRAILADVTCDSDGKLERFIDLHDVKKVLELHPFDGKDYYIGAFLIGAYQEILGDLHNLFGDTNAVHVSLDDNGEVTVDHVVKGDTVHQILKYVEYNPEELMTAMRRDIERAVRDKKITLEESARFLRFYESGMNGYTYLEDPHER